MALTHSRTLSPMDNLQVSKNDETHQSSDAKLKPPLKAKRGRPILSPAAQPDTEKRRAQIRKAQNKYRQKRDVEIAALKATLNVEKDKFAVIRENLTRIHNKFASRGESVDSEFLRTIQAVLQIAQPSTEAGTDELKSEPLNRYMSEGSADLMPRASEEQFPTFLGNGFGDQSEMGMFTDLGSAPAFDGLWLDRPGAAPFPENSMELEVSSQNGASMMLDPMAAQHGLGMSDLRFNGHGHHDASNYADSPSYQQGSPYHPSPNLKNWYPKMLWNEPVSTGRQHYRSSFAYALHHRALARAFLLFQDPNASVYDMASLFQAHQLLSKNLLFVKIRRMLHDGSFPEYFQGWEAGSAAVSKAWNDLGMRGNGASPSAVGVNGIAGQTYPQLVEPDEETANPNRQQWFSASDVELYFRTQKGMIFSDTDLVQVEVPDVIPQWPHPPQCQQIAQSAINDRTIGMNAQHQSIRTDGDSSYLAPDRPKKRLVKVSIFELIEALVQYGVCLDRGPGFDKPNVDKAVAFVLSTY